MSTEWLLTLPQKDRFIVENLLNKLTTLGVDRSKLDLKQIIQAYLDEDPSEVAKIIFLHRLQQQADLWRKVRIREILKLEEKCPGSGQIKNSGQVLERLVKSGVNINDLEIMAQEIAYSVIQEVLYIIDEGYHPDVDEPGGDNLIASWKLMCGYSDLQGLHDLFPVVDLQS